MTKELDGNLSLKVTNNFNDCIQTSSWYLSVALYKIHNMHVRLVGSYDIVSSNKYKYRKNQIKTLGLKKTYQSNPDMHANSLGFHKSKSTSRKNGNINTGYNKQIIKYQLKSLIH